MTGLTMDRLSRSDSSDPLVEGFRAVYKAELARLVRLAHLITGSNAAAEDLIEQGTHPAVIASRLGHTSVRTVLDVYGHLYEELDRGSRRLPGVTVGRI